MTGPQNQQTIRHANLSSAVRATSLMTLGSRVGGMVRDVVVARIFGDTPIGSAFAAGFAIPNMFRRLFGEGALSAAFIPEYTRAHRDDPEQANRLASLTLAALGVVTSGLTVLIEIGLLLAIVLGSGNHERVLSIQLVMLMLPFMPLICMVAILAGMLQVHGKFAAAASGPVILNAFIIAVGAYFLYTKQLGGEFTAYTLSVVTVLSGLSQLLWFFKLLKNDVRWTRKWQNARPLAKNMLGKFVPVAIGLGTLQLNTFLDTLIAMWPIWVGTTVLGVPYPLDGSSNVILSLAARLYQFPLGVFGIAIASAAFPLLARHAHEPKAFADTLRRALRMSLFIGLPASVGMLLVREDLIAVLFGSGKTGWTPASLHRASNVLMGFSIAIWAYSLNQVFTRAFYAQSDTQTPMRVSIAMILVNVTLNVTLIFVPGLLESGLAWATATSAIIQTFVLGFLCARLLKRMSAHEAEHIVDAHMLKGALKIVFATVLMGTAVLYAGGFLSALILKLPASVWVHQIMRLGAVTALGGGVYLLAAKLLKASELSWMMHRSVRKA